MTFCSARVRIETCCRQVVSLICRKDIQAEGIQMSIRNCDAENLQMDDLEISRNGITQSNEFQMRGLKRSAAAALGAEFSSDDERGPYCGRQHIYSP